MSAALVEERAAAEGTEGRIRIILAASLGAALNPLNSTMIAVALPALSADFHASAASVTLTVVTGYLVATLVSQVPAGNIADRVGYGRALAWGRWLFLAGALAGAFAPALWAVVAGRLVMAAGGSLVRRDGRGARGRRGHRTGHRRVDDRARRLAIVVPHQCSDSGGFVLAAAG